MNLSRQTTIAGRLKLLSYVIGVALLAIVILYVATAILENNITGTQTELSAYQMQVSQLESDMLLARRAEKDFIMRHEVEQLEKHDSIMKQIFARIDHLKKLSPTENLTAQLDTVRINMQAYQRGFQTLSKLMIDVGLDENSGSTGALRNAVHDVEDQVNKLGEIHLLASMLMMRRHEKDYFMRLRDEYVIKHGDEYSNFIYLLNTSSLEDAPKRAVRNLIEQYRDKFVSATLASQKQVATLEALREAVHKVEPVLEDLQQRSAAILADRTRTLEMMGWAVKIAFFALLALIAIIIARVGRTTFHAILQPLGHLHHTVSEVSSGNFDARTRLTTEDEIGDLARAFDNMLDDRLKALEDAMRENDQLNNSIIDLLEAVAQLSDRDLTVLVPVKEDVTGPVADAMNMMASETAKVLAKINAIAADVASAAVSVREQGSKVIEMANDERQVVDQTLERLNNATAGMNEIAELAKRCNDIAVKASDTTSNALRTVDDTVAGMAEIREIISETEKRIKRLGERSQEITGIVEIINDIADQTHVLALNASMQAAVAGEAGRGFAVVADEVQRLAESSRNSTSQIASLVNNIRTETADTMATMNRAIEQVIAGSNLAEQTGQQMQETMRTTNELVAGVNDIFERSNAQAVVSNFLLEQARNIQKSTEVTSEELAEQGAHTENLVMFSKYLVDSVKVFKLPATA